MTVWKSSANVGDEMHVQGLSELRNVLLQLPARLQNNVLRGALRAAAVVIADDARRRAPVRTGQLRASVRVTSGIVNGRPVVFVKVGSRYTVFKIGKKGQRTKDPYRTKGAGGSVEYHAAFYAHFVEFGTSKMAAHPFMRPAFESRKEAAVEAFKAYLIARLPKELAALGVTG